MPSDLRMFTRVTFISQAETKSGRNSAVGITEAAGVATCTSAQAHNYLKDQRVYFSGATGGNAPTYNDPQGFKILTVPSATTFTFALPSGTGNAVGAAILADMPIDCAGQQLASVLTPATFTGIALTFEGDVEGTPASGGGTFSPIKGPTGAALSWVVAASGLYVPDSVAQQFASIVKIKLVSGSAEAAVRRMVASFILTNPY